MYCLKRRRSAQKSTNLAQPKTSAKCIRFVVFFCAPIVCCLCFVVLALGIMTCCVLIWRNRDFWSSGLGFAFHRRQLSRPLALICLRTPASIMDSKPLRVFLASPTFTFRLGPGSSRLPGCAHDCVFVVLGVCFCCVVAVLMVCFVVLLLCSGCVFCVCFCACGVSLLCFFVLGVCFCCGRFVLKTLCFSQFAPVHDSSICHTTVPSVIRQFRLSYDSSVCHGCVFSCVFTTKKHSKTTARAHLEHTRPQI